MKSFTVVLVMALVFLTGAFTVAFAAMSPPPVHPPQVRTCQYWTVDRAVSAVVVTRGVNCSKTASFTIKAYPYDGAVFSPEGGVSAFSLYLQQISEWVNGPGYSRIPATALHRIGYIDNAYTNHEPTTVYSGPGTRYDGAASSIWSLLTTGLPWAGGINARP